MKKTAEQKQADDRQQVRTMQSLDELQALVEAPLKVVFKLDQHALQIDVKRMSPAVSEKQRAILRAVQPPFKKDRGTSGDYDPLDVKYLEARDAAERKARAMVVYHCCPIVSAKKPGASDDEIEKLVSSILTPNLIELIAVTAQSGGLQMMEAANFMHPSGSDQS